MNKRSITNFQLDNIRVRHNNPHRKIWITRPVMGIGKWLIISVITDSKNQQKSSNANQFSTIFVTDRKR